MDESRATLASILIRLRTAIGMTQAELGEKLNYSDKTVSKWERGDSVPDVFVLQQIAELYGVTVDTLLRDPDRKEPSQPATPNPNGYSTAVITAVAILGVWTIAFTIFVILWIMNVIVWDVFFYAVPVSLIAFLVLHSIWKGGRWNVYIVAALILTTFLAIYITLLLHMDTNPWQLLLVIIPAELVGVLSFRIRKRS